MDNHPGGSDEITTPAPNMPMPTSHTATSSIVEACPDHSELAEVMTKKDLYALVGTIQKFEKLGHGNWLPWKAHILDMHPRHAESLWS